VAGRAAGDPLSSSVRGPAVGKLGVDDLEDMSLARLSGEGVEELLDAATECTLVFSGPDGWPMG